MNVKETRFVKALAAGKSAEEAAKAAGYSAAYARRLCRRADVCAEAARLKDRESAAKAKRELKEYLLEVMRGGSSEECAKIADRMRAAEFYDRYFDESAEDNVLEVIVDYGDTT